MPDITILTETEIRRMIPLDMDAVACVEEGFRALATTDVVMPPILHLEIKDANGEIDVKTAYVPGLPSFALKTSAGFFDNPKLGLPSTSGMMVVYSASTGAIETLLLENGYLTDLRTAAAGAVAARHLARKDATRVGIVGAGAQARYQLEAMTLARTIERAQVWARDPKKADAFATAMMGKLGIPVLATDDLKTLADDSDILVTTTPATEPLIEQRHLHRGLTIIAMGSDAAYKNEIDPGVFAAVDRYVCDRKSQVRILGELHHAIGQGVVAPGDRFPELGEIVAGKEPGRSNDEEMILCDLTGTGVQDTAIAILAADRGRATGAGTTIST